MNLSPEQTKSIKNKVDTLELNFQEVDKGYTYKMMLEEADRCLSCKHEPCVKACPLHLPIPQFISALKTGDVETANELIRTKSDFSAFCSRVCDVAKQCEEVCVRAIKHEAVGINYLERYVSDNHQLKLHKKPPLNGKRVAIIGSGPAGMACAQDLAKQGFYVTLFSKESYAGGILAYGVPSYRLPVTLLYEKLEELNELGVRFKYNKTLGIDISLIELTEKYDAVFLGLGEEGAQPLNIPGDDLEHIYSSYDYLKRVNEHRLAELKHFKKVLVIGGGNTAMDCARVARRLGAEVVINYRRTLTEMPASKQEIEEAQEEGISFDLLSSPVEIKGNKVVEKVVCIRRETTEPDQNGRMQTQEISGSEYEVDVDCVIKAIGSTPNRTFRSNVLGLKTNERGHLWVDENHQTSMEKVYAGGDVVLGANTVVRAVATGKKAAAAISKVLLSEV